MSAAARPRTVRYNPRLRRHSWNQTEQHWKRCTWCGIRVHNRPDPHGPAWFQEWDWPDAYPDMPTGHNYGGGKVPGCPGPTDSIPAVDPIAEVWTAYVNVDNGTELAYATLADTVWRDRVSAHRWLDILLPHGAVPHGFPRGSRVIGLLVPAARTVDPVELELDWSREELFVQGVTS